jgi:hypothetical protein
VRAQSRLAVVPRPRRERGAVERIHARAILRNDRDMHRFFELAFAADPEIRFAFHSEPGGRISAYGLRGGGFHHQRVTERSQRLRVERLRRHVVGHRKTDVIDHARLLRNLVQSEPFASREQG